MIVVDSSVWIELLSNTRVRPVPEWELLQFCTSDPIIQEALQGLKSESPRRV